MLRRLRLGEGLWAELLPPFKSPVFPRQLLQRGVHFPGTRSGKQRRARNTGTRSGMLFLRAQRCFTCYNALVPAQRSGLPQRTGSPSGATGARGARGVNPNSFGFIPLRAGRLATLWFQRVGLDRRNSFRCGMHPRFPAAVARRQGRGFFSLREPEGEFSF